MTSYSLSLAIYLVIAIVDQSLIQILADGDVAFTSSWNEKASVIKISVHTDSSYQHYPAPPPPPTPPPRFIPFTDSVMQTFSGEWSKIDKVHYSVVEFEDNNISPSLTQPQFHTIMIHNSSSHLMDSDAELQTSNVSLSVKSFDATIPIGPHQSTLQPTPSITHLATVMSSSFIPPMGEVQPSATSPWSQTEIFIIESARETKVVVYILILEGDCSFLSKDKKDFETEFQKQLSDILSINHSKIIVYETKCGSVIVNFTIKGADSNLTAALQRLIDTQLFVIKFKEQNFTAVQITTFGEYSLRQSSDMNWEWIIYIAAGAVGGLLILIITTICTVRIYRKSHGKSFDVATDSTHGNVTLEDYTLTRIPRPKTVYTYGVYGNTSRYHEYDENIKSNGIAISDVPEKEPKQNIAEEGTNPAPSSLKPHADNAVAKESPLRTFKQSPQKDNAPPSPSGSSSPETYHGKSRSKEALSKESLDDIGKDGVENPIFKTEEGSLIDTPVEESRQSTDNIATVSVSPAKVSESSQAGKDNPSFVNGPELANDGDRNNN